MRPEPDRDASKKIFLPRRPTALSLLMRADTGAENPSYRQNAAVSSAMAKRAGLKSRVSRLAMETSPRA
jgi:hypothetical protein